MKIGLVVAFPIMVEIQRGWFDPVEFHDSLERCKDAFKMVQDRVTLDDENFQGRIEWGSPEIRIAKNYLVQDPPPVEVVRNIRPARKKGSLRRKPPKPQE